MANCSFLYNCEKKAPEIAGRSLIPTPLYGTTLLPNPRSLSRVSASVDPKAIIALNDQLLPEHSYDHSLPFLHWRLRKNTREWYRLKR